jgi:hypothetical protein
MTANFWSVSYKSQPSSRSKVHSYAVDSPRMSINHEYTESADPCVPAIWWNWLYAGDIRAMFKPILGFLSPVTSERL